MDDSQRKLVAEFIGTFALIFFGAGSALQGADLVGQALSQISRNQHHGDRGGAISGGHFNPAVTLSMLVTGRITPAEAVRYWVSQLAGGVAAAFVLLAAFPSAVTDAVNLGVALGGHGISTGNALAAEIVTTFFLVFVIYGVAVDKRGAFSTLRGLPIGLTISIGVLAVGAVSGAVQPRPLVRPGTRVRARSTASGSGSSAGHRRDARGPRLRPDPAQGRAEEPDSSPLIPCGGTALPFHHAAQL